MRVLCVCLGNICRSPTAEGVLRDMATARGLALEVDSAGTGDYHRGSPPYGPAQAAARARGYDLSGQRARQVRREDFDRFDHILVMDRQNLADVQEVAPPAARARVALFADPEEIPDSYYTRDFDGALDMIEAAARRFLDQLQ